MKVLTLATPDSGPVRSELAFEDVFRQHSARVHRHAYRLARKSQDAEDITQEVFLRVFRFLPRYDPDLGSIEAWLYRITLNCFVDRIQRERRLRVDLDPDVDSRPCPAPDPHQLAADRVLDTDIRAALGELTVAQAQTVLLHDVDGLDYGEIAAELGIASGTVGSRLCRGHATLRAALAHRAPAPTIAA